METKNIEQVPSQSNRSAVIQSLLPILKRILLILAPIYLVIGVSYFGLFSKSLTEFALQISAVAIFLLGLPLSAGLRVDQMSMDLGGRYPREVILIIASLVTWLNLTLIMGFRAWIKTPIKKS